MKTTVRELKTLIKHQLNEAPEYTLRLRTSDGRAYEADAYLVNMQLSHMGVPFLERSGILSGQMVVRPVIMTALVRVNAARPVPKPHKPSKRSAAALGRKPRMMSPGSAQGKLNALAKRYAKNWKNFSFADYENLTPEDAAPDAALGFFTDYPEWEKLASIAKMPKYEVRSMVTDYVYDAMTR